MTENIDDKFDYEGISLHSESWEETEKKLKDNIDNCNSVSKLRKLRQSFEALLEQIRLSKVFFRCENNSNNTRISLSLSDGTEFMNFVCLGCFKEVFPDEQQEILEYISQMYESSIHQIDERLSVIEKLNEKEKTKDFLTAIIMVILGTILLMFHKNISETIVRNMNISGIDSILMKKTINIMFIFSEIFFMMKPAVIAMKWFIRENL